MRMRQAGHMARRMGEMINTHRILFGKSEEKRQLARPRSWWEDNIRLVIKDIRWTHLAHDQGWKVAFVNTVMNHFVPQKERNILAV
jgi:hypothetical protein